jgi:trimeric autotransporter adhesin
MTGHGSRLTRCLRVALLVLLTGWGWAVEAQVPDKINYQGKLTNPGGQPINGPVSMVFKIYSGPSGGSALYTETQTVTVANGIFNVAIGSVTPLALPFNVPYYLGITAGTDAEMTPREAVLTSPYAFQAVSAVSATSATTAQGLAAAGAVTIFSGGTRVLQLQSVTGGLTQSTNAVNVLGGSPLNTIKAGVVAATIAGGGGTFGARPLPNSVQADYGTVSGGGGNTASGLLSTIGGGDGNIALGSESTVAGGGGNTTSGNDSTVAGGGFNTASGAYSAIGGGNQNTASASSSTVGGGFENTASGGVSTVAGGDGNTASGIGSTVAGGLNNIASGDYSFAAGHSAKTQTAGASPTIHNGAFVWADANGFVDFNSAASNEFSARATGGVRFVTAIDGSGNPTQTVAINTNGEMNFGNKTRQMLKLWDQGTAHYGIGVQNAALYFRTDAANNFAWFAGGSHSDATFDAGSGGTVLMTLTPGSSTSAPTGTARAQSFVNVSDRNAKAEFAPIDARAVLERVITLPVSTWVYRTDPSTPHIGPVAQDFHAAFGVGSDDKTINTVDEGGIALGAIQGLNAKLEERLGEKDREIAALKQQVAEIAALKQQVAQLVRLQGDAALVAALDANSGAK